MQTQPIYVKATSEELARWKQERDSPPVPRRTYHILFTSKTQRIEGKVRGFIGEVISLWEPHTSESLQARLTSLSGTHGVDVSEMEIA